MLQPTVSKFKKIYHKMQITYVLQRVLDIVATIKVPEICGILLTQKTQYAKSKHLCRECRNLRHKQLYQLTMSTLAAGIIMKLCR